MPVYIRPARPARPAQLGRLGREQAEEVGPDDAVAVDFANGQGIICRLLGVAFSSVNPLSVVLTKETVGLTAPLELSLVVNELSEGDHLQWALAHPPTPIHRPWG